MKTTLALFSFVVLAASVAASGCGEDARDEAKPSIVATPLPALSAQPTFEGPPSTTPLLPSNPSALAPAHVVAGAGIDGSVLTETESCAGCHADAAAQWRTSAHAFGSFNNPAYRVAVDRFRKVVGNDASRFCGGCHDAALLVDGAMSKDVAPTDPRAHGGITCRVCHGIESARSDGNGSFTLASSPVPIPKEGDAESVRAHKARMALAPLRTAQLCGSCHRSFLGSETGNASHLVGMDELSSWSESAYAGSLATRVDEPIVAQECRQCHMPLEDATRGDAAAKNGKIASHRFLGAHTWLAAMRGDPEQLARAQAMLRGAASVDIAAVGHANGARDLPAEAARLAPGESVVLDVVVKNEHVAHRFPGGTLDAQDVWIEVAAYDACGRLVADAGAAHERTGDDPTAHRLRAVQADDHGKPVEMRETDRFRAVVFNHTIAPRDAEVARYRLDVPKDAALPLRVVARLRHRSRNLALFAATCAEGKTPRGAQFAAEVAKRAGGRGLDPCAPEPVTDVATHEVTLGAEPGSPSPGSRPTWLRLADHALGMLHALQEQADEARPSLERALVELDTTGTSRDRARVLALFADLAVREGRTSDAMQWLARASVLVPDHPALDRIRGEALTSVWRWQEALAPLRDAAQKAPSDDSLWMHLAVAYGSAGVPIDALAAAKHGLALQPRDQDLLRVQGLALEALRAPSEDVERARDAFGRFRTPDDAPRIKSLCTRDVPGCALERIPVHVHAMRAR